MITALIGRPNRGLVTTLTLRLVLSVIVVMALQVGLVAVRDYINEIDFLNSYIRREALSLARAFPDRMPSRGDRRALSLPAQYTGPHAAGYSFRILEADGRVVAEHNPGLLIGQSLPRDRPSLRQDFWLRRLESGERMHVAGGLRVRRERGDLWVELATVGDPADTYLSNIARDILDDVWVPALPLIALTIIVATLSVRRSLRPLVDAATRADEISALERRDRLDTEALPAEAAHFASAVNRLLDRVSDLVSAHRLFMARAAHELRTPISIMMLEIGNLKEPNSRILEADLRTMSQIVDQLLTLSRLMTIEKPSHEAVDLTATAHEVVTRMLGWAQSHGHAISFTSSRAEPVFGDETALREAIRNLVENAVKHTPAGTKIKVDIMADASIVVEDSGPGLGSQSIDELQMPFRKGLSTNGGAGLGLAIVRQAAELHGGRLEIGASDLGGARFTVRLNSERVTLPLAA